MHLTHSIVVAGKLFRLEDRKQSVRESKMSIIADNSWDTREGFSLPHASSKTHVVSDSRANILGTEDRKTQRFPGNSGMPVEESDFVGKLEALDAASPLDADEATRWNQVLGMWLQWSSAYEEVAGRMFEEGEDAEKLEALLDEIDQLRLDAVELSEGLLEY
jgi:hypothetical protein